MNNRVGTVIDSKKAPLLPQNTLELLAEVAVLEEEVVRLEEQVVNFRQGLYQDADCLSSSKSADDSKPSSNESSVKSHKQRHSRSSSQSEVNLGSLMARPSPCLSRSTTRKFLSFDGLSDGTSPNSERLTNGKQSQNEPALALENGLEKENQTGYSSDKYNPSPEKKLSETGIHLKRRQLKPELTVKNVNSPKMQSRIVEQAQESTISSSYDRVLEIESEANKMSEDILKCLISIFVRLSSSKMKAMGLESLSSLATRTFGEKNVGSDFHDPYSNSEFKKRDIGAYKHFYSLEAGSFDLNIKPNASFLIGRLKILVDKLATVKLDRLSHQQKLAFWINTYNSCIMNAFLEHGIPGSPDMTIALMQKATIKVAGQMLNALMIEQFILRLPYHLKFTCSKAAKNEAMKACRTFGLEWSEPLVTFALFCGSWSSPAVRVYTASQIETDLETAKRDYLQASVGISSTNKLIIPKLLDWYLLEFAKNLDALLDWVCLQLPNELRDEAVSCLERKGKEPVSKLVQIVPYEFSFRYLIYQ